MEVSHPTNCQHIYDEFNVNVCQPDCCIIIVILWELVKHFYLIQDIML